MHDLIVLVPSLLAGDTQWGSLSRMELLQKLASIGELASLPPHDCRNSIEPAFFGLNPRTVDLRQGPLTAAALGADAPARSIQYHVSLLSIEDHTLELPGHDGQVDLQLIWAELKRLETQSMRIVGSRSRDGALIVLDGSPDMDILSPEGVLGRPLRECWPQAEDEVLLRKFIDDSINLLTDLECNHRRIDEGLQPINIAWPWGGGLRPAIPNLLLTFGRMAHIESHSIRLQGLARLSGWKHGDRNAFGTATNTRFESILENVIGKDLGIVVFDVFEQFVSYGKDHEFDWLCGEFDRRFLGPILSEVRSGSATLLFVAPSGNSETAGLALQCPTTLEASSAQRFGVDSIALDKPPSLELWEHVDAYIRREHGNA